MPYVINIKRGKNKGKLKFTHGATSVDTTCWWDSAVKVDVGEYTSYATRMANKNDGITGNKKREAIWLGRNVPVNKNTRKSNEIFVHKGTSAAWSDGCIVIANSEVMKIWNAVTPKEAGNITVKITDE
ncbi:MAG: hypothetical protein NPIRA01_08130 [Nitrospirales bacterium]|nr:MAG: hypothetical protein NPIRA01_08130 [Nitrospirales bacterium]